MSNLKQQNSAKRRIIWVINVLALIMMNGCVKIIIRHDTLTAAQHNDLGVAYLNEKQNAAAEHEFKAAIKKSNGYWLAHYNLGTLYLQNNNLKKADYHLAKTTILNPEYPDAYNNLAIVRLRQKDYTHALYFAELALKHSSEKNYLYLDTLVSIHRSLNNLKEECTALRTLLEICPASVKEAYQLKYNERCMKN